MELLHGGCIKDAGRWNNRPEQVQENLSDRMIQIQDPNPELASPVRQQQAISPSPIASVSQRPSQVKDNPSTSRWEATLQELTLYEVSVESSCSNTEVAKLFKTNSLLPGILISQEGSFFGMVSRRRFFECISRPYSWQLFSKRSLQSLYKLVKTEILVLSDTTSIVAGAQQCLQRSPDLLYEPIVVQDAQGVYKLLDVHQLLLAQSQIHDSAIVALQEAETKYRGIFENAVDGIFQTTPEGRYISANPALAQIYGYDSPEELIASFTNIEQQLYVNPNRRIQFRALMQQHDAVSGFESEVYRKDGSIIWIKEKARAVRDANGNLLCYEGMVEDITDRKQAEEALRQSEAKLRQQTTELEKAIQEVQQMQSQLIQTEKMSSLGQLVAGVAHEINNPVNSIYSNLPYASQYTQDLLDLVQLYRKYYPQPAEEIITEAEAIDLEFLMGDLPKILSAMQQGAERISEIVRSLRNFSRLEQGKMQLADIHTGIDSTLLILQHRLKPKQGSPGIQVIKEYGDLPLVECYAGQLNQVFMNLLANAIDALEQVMANEQFSSQDFLPTIWIRTKVIDEHWVSIRIADNANGIPEEVKKQVFDAFFTTKSVGKGTGLGLSISYQIVVEKHGGELRCISAPGKGAEFAIALPIQQ